MGWVTRTNLKGPTGTIDSATAIVLAPGATPTITLTGTPAKRGFAFGIPQGPEGAQGLPGVNAVENDTAVAGYINTDGSSETKTAVITTIANRASARRIRLILALGQSNMSGRGNPYSLLTDPIHPRIFQCGSGAPTITPASEPLDMHDAPSGIGPALQFARHYISSVTSDDIVLLIPAAHSGTALSTTDTLGWRWGVANNLSAQALSQTQYAMDQAATKWPGATITVDAALWLQGEGDTDAALYQTDLDNLIAGFRDALNVPNLPFIIGQMVPEGIAETPTRAEVDRVQSQTPYRVAATGFALGPQNAQNGDKLHYNAHGQRIMGQRMFDEYERVMAGLAPTNPVSIPWHTYFDANRLQVTNLAQVATWTDSSGHGRNATQGTAANQPVYHSAIDGKPAYVSFDGGDRLATAAFGATVAQPMTIIAAIRPAAAIAVAGGTGPFFHGIDSTNMVILQQRESSGLQRLQVNAGTNAFASPTLNIAGWNIVSVVLNGATSSVRLNGVATTISPGTKGIAGITLGASYDGTAAFTGDITELGVYVGTLDTGTLQAAESALADRCGVTI